MELISWLSFSQLTLSQTGELSYTPCQIPLFHMSSGKIRVWNFFQVKRNVEA